MGNGCWTVYPPRNYSGSPAPLGAWEKQSTGYQPVCLGPEQCNAETVAVAGLAVAGYALPSCPAQV